jgi:hypothetical protein
MCLSNHNVNEFTIQRLLDLHVLPNRLLYHTINFKRPWTAFLAFLPMKYSIVYIKEDSMFGSKVRNKCFLRVCVWNFQQWNFSLPPEKKNHESWLRLLDVLCHCHERVMRWKENIKIIYIQRWHMLISVWFLSDVYSKDKDDRKVS